MRFWAVPAAPVIRWVGALATLALALAFAPAPILLFICPLFICPAGIWPLVFIWVLLFIWAPPPACAPRTPALPFMVAPLFIVAPAGGAVMVAPPLVAAPAPTLPAGVETVWAPAVPAAATRAIVNRVRFIRGILLGVGSRANARRGTDVPLRHFLLCPHFATGVALRPIRRGNARGVRLHHRGRRLGRIGHGQPAVGAQRQQGAGLRGRPGHAARRGAAGDHAIPTPAPPISIRASTGPSSRSIPRSSATTIRTRTARRCASTSRPACWAAARRSTARWPTAARRPTTPNGWRAAPRAGSGTRSCPTSRRSSAISTSPTNGTARTAASRCAASRSSTGPSTRPPSPRPASSPA